ncbi:MAG: ankyrin repeat domain-containing protein [Candidatus Dependentiae bacterium]
MLIRKLSLTFIFICCLAGISCDAAQKEECRTIATQIIQRFDPKIELLEGLQENNLKKVKFALESGASPDEDLSWQIKEGTLHYTPLTLIASNKDKTSIDIAKLLLQYGANVNKKDKMENSPLVRAIWKENYPLVDLLIAENADINQVSHSMSPLTVALNFRNNNLALKLLESGANADIDILNSAIATSANILLIKKIIKKGIDVNNKDNCNRTPIEIAVTVGNYQALEYLLSQGADVNIKSGVGGLNQTPLEMAINQKNIGMVDFLLEHGASITGAYEYALKGGTPEIAELIRQHEEKLAQSK